MRQFLLLLFLIICNLSLSQTINSNCNESYLLSDIENSSNYTYNAQNSITTENNYKVIASNNEIRMKAGKVIVLKPNTYIKKASVYLARIEPCTVCPLSFSYNNFFTPNEDGYNDFWKVNWANQLDFFNVYIYDRYGKLVKTLMNNQDYWDGKYNSKDLFSSDYWFKLVYTDCNGNQKEYKSHFSLKR